MSSDSLLKSFSSFIFSQSYTASLLGAKSEQEPQPLISHQHPQMPYNPRCSRSPQSAAARSLHFVNVMFCFCFIYIIIEHQEESKGLLEWGKGRMQQRRWAWPRSQVVASHASHHFFLFLFSAFHHVVRIFSSLLKKYKRK